MGQTLDTAQEREQRNPEAKVPASPEVSTPKTTESVNDTGAGEPANDASHIKVSDSVSHEGTSGHGHGEPVPKSTNIPDPAPDHSRGADEGNGPAPLGS